MSKMLEIQNVSFVYLLYRKRAVSPLSGKRLMLSYILIQQNVNLTAQPGKLSIQNAIFRIGLVGYCFIVIISLATSS